MQFRLIRGRLLAGLALSGLVLGVTGCQSGGTGGAEVKPPDPKVKASELVGYCPTVTLREGTAYFNAYAKGGQDDPAKLQYQASISDVTRSCSRNGDMLTITVAVAGKVVPGPAGAGGSITMPIRVAAIQGDTVLYSQLAKHQVAVGDGAAATQFVFSDPNVVIPNPTERDIQIFAGFDEGPPKKSAQTQ